MVISAWVLLVTVMNRTLQMSLDSVSEQFHFRFIAPSSPSEEGPPLPHGLSQEAAHLEDICIVECALLQLDERLRHGGAEKQCLALVTTGQSLWVSEHTQ